LRLFRSGPGKSGIAEDEARIEEHKTRIESPNCEGLSRLARQDYKRERGANGVARRAKFSLPRTATAAESTFAPARPEIQGEQEKPRASRLDCARKLDIVHCSLNVCERYPRCEETRNGSANKSEHRHARSQIIPISTRRFRTAT